MCFFSLYFKIPFSISLCKKDVALLCSLRPRHFRCQCLVQALIHYLGLISCLLVIVKSDLTVFPKQTRPQNNFGFPRDFLL